VAASWLGGVAKILKKVTGFPAMIMLRPAASNVIHNFLNRSVVRQCIVMVSEEVVEPGVRTYNIFDNFSYG
jgi:hypothetical protein